MEAVLKERGSCGASRPSEAGFSFGIEEEYFLIDRETRAVAGRMPEGFLAAAKAALGERVTGEFLQSQIEIVTAPQTDMRAAGAELRRLRRDLDAIARACSISPEPAPGNSSTSNSPPPAGRHWPT